MRTHVVGRRPMGCDRRPVGRLAWRLFASFTQLSLASKRGLLGHSYECTGGRTGCVTSRFDRRLRSVFYPRVAPSREPLSLVSRAERVCTRVSQPNPVTERRENDGEKRQKRNAIVPGYIYTHTHTHRFFSWAAEARGYRATEGPLPK